MDNRTAPPFVPPHIPWGEVVDDPEDLADNDDDAVFDDREPDANSPHPMGSTSPLPASSSTLFPLFIRPSPTTTGHAAGRARGRGDPAKRKDIATSNAFDALTDFTMPSLSDRISSKKAKQLSRLSSTRADYLRPPPSTAKGAATSSHTAASSLARGPAAAGSTPSSSPSSSPSCSSPPSSSSSFPPQMVNAPPTTALNGALTASVAAFFAAGTLAAPPPQPVFPLSAGSTQPHLPLGSQLPAELPPPSPSPVPLGSATPSPLTLPTTLPPASGQKRRGGGSAGRRRRRLQEEKSPPEGKEERKDGVLAQSSPPPSSSSSSPSPSAPPATHSSRSVAPAAAGPGSHLPAPSLPSRSRAHPQSRLLESMCVPRESPVDFVATITFPPLGGRGLSTLPRPAHHSGSSMVGANNAAHLLEASLHIPPPRLLKALSRFDTPTDLLVYLKSLLALQASCLLDTLGPYINGLEAALNLLKAKALDGPAQVLEALCATPKGMDVYCHSSYLDYFTSRTAIIKSYKTPAKEQRHVIRIGFNSPLVQLAMQRHLEQYIALLCPSPAPAPTRADIAGMLPWQAEWTRRCIPTSAIHSHLQLAPYEYRYETTRVSGFTRGPDCHPPLEHHDNLAEPFGNLNSFLAFLSASAPHCYAGKVDYTPDGRAYLQLVHEMPYRSELFRLNGMTSPRHGITRPLRLSYFQQQVPAARCCSHCGEGDHQAHGCPLRATSAPTATEAESDADMTGGLPVHPAGHRAGVCRDCYSPEHQQTCDTDPATVTCRLCKEKGHTSFRCSRYRAQWVPLSLPASTAPMSTRPLIVSCIQRGVPWNAIAASASLAPSISGPGLAPPPASAFPPLQPSTAAARVRPPAPPASPTDSLASPAPSQPVSPSSPASPASLDERFNQLQQALLTMQAESKAFQERQSQELRQFQQQQQTLQLQLQAQLLGLHAQLESQQQAFKANQASVDNRFLALLYHLGAGASPASGPGPFALPTPGLTGPVNLPATHPASQPVVTYMQTGGSHPPTSTTPSPAPIPIAQTAPAAPQPPQPALTTAPIVNQIVVQSGARASAGPFHTSLPSGTPPMMSPPGPPSYSHLTQPSSSSPTSPNDRVPSPQ